MILVKFGEGIWYGTSWIVYGIRRLFSKDPQRILVRIEKILGHAEPGTREKLQKELSSFARQMGLYISLSDDGHSSVEKVVLHQVPTRASSSEEIHREDRKEIEKWLRQLQYRWQKAKKVYGRIEQLRVELKQIPKGVVGFVGAMVALIGDWWISSATLERFTVSFGFAPWLFALIVSVVDMVFAVFATGTGYLAKTPLQQERYRKIGLIGLVTLALLKFIMFAWYVQDENPAYTWTSWDFWQTVLLQGLFIIVVYMVFKWAGEGFIYAGKLLQIGALSMIGESPVQIEKRYDEIRVLLHDYLPSGTNINVYLQDRGLALNEPPPVASEM